MANRKLSLSPGPNFMNPLQAWTSLYSLPLQACMYKFVQFTFTSLYLQVCEHQVFLSHFLVNSVGKFNLLMLVLKSEDKCQCGFDNNGYYKKLKKTFACKYKPDRAISWTSFKTTLVSQISSRQPYKTILES